MRFPLQLRRGATLVELLLFLAFFALVSGIVLSVLFATNEQRVQQRVTSAVERTGVQVIQILRRRVQHAERIFNPALGESGAFLALQGASEEENPTIIANESGTLMLVRHDTEEALTGEDVTLSKLTVWNTSASRSRQSALLSFDLTTDIPLPSATVRSYTRHFETLITLFPDDHLNGASCGCAPPQCESGVYRWNVCDGGVCVPATTVIGCE